MSSSTVSRPRHRIEIGSTTFSIVSGSNPDYDIHGDKVAIRQLEETIDLVINRNGFTMPLLIERDGIKKLHDFLSQFVED